MNNKVRLIPYKVNEVKPDYFLQLGAEVIHAPFMWDKTKGNVVVAILDTGIDMYHSDLRSNIIDGYNFTSDYERDVKNYSDNHGHGSHVAGIVKSVAPNVKFLILKVLAGSGSGWVTWISSAIDFAANWTGINGEKVKVISMSLSTSASDEGMHKSIIRATEAGISVVCASGNSGDNNPDTDEKAYPAMYPEVISVGACDNNTIPAYFSNSNLEVDCVAPGVDIFSTYMNGDFATMSGTSMATPHISGALALIASAQPTLTEDERFQQLIKCTRDLGYKKSLQGNGIIDLSKYTPFIKEDKLMIKNLFVCYGDADIDYAKLLRAFTGGYVVLEEDFISNPIPAERIFKIGGTYKPQGNVVVLAGKSRRETSMMVLDFIKTLK